MDSIDKITNEARELVGEKNDINCMNQYIAEVMKKIEHQKMLVKLSPSVKKRIRALRKLQVQTTNLDSEFHRMVYELERTYLEKHNDIFSKRRNILNGDHEPTEEECDYSDPKIATELAQAYTIEDDINASKMESDEPSNPKGVPDFWLNIFKFSPLIGSIVTCGDEPILKHLIDVKVTSKPLPDLSFALEFYFSPNEYFTNSVLTKEYLMKCSADPQDPFSFDGPEIYDSRGCEINWKDDMHSTEKMFKKTLKLDDRLKNYKMESFFDFFDPPHIPENTQDIDFDEINSLLEDDFEIGHYLKERIVPRAILYFTAEVNDDSTDVSSNDLSLTHVSEEENNEEEETIGEGCEGEGDGDIN